MTEDKAATEGTATHYEGLPEVCTPKQWAEFFGVSLKTVYRMADEGQLHSIKIRGCLRICRDKSLEMLGTNL